MSNEKIRFIAKLMGAWILAYERRRISVRRISPPAKVTFWISDKTFFFLVYTIQWLPTSPLRCFVFPMEQARNASDTREWLVTKGNGPWEGGRRETKRLLVRFLVPAFPKTLHCGFMQTYPFFQVTQRYPQPVPSVRRNCSLLYIRSRPRATWNLLWKVLLLAAAGWKHLAFAINT